MNWVYLSFPIQENTPLYGGPKGKISLLQINPDLQSGPSREMQLSLPNHCSTHLDFPAHFCPEGKRQDDYDADFWVFNKIGWLETSAQALFQQIPYLPHDIEALLLKTGFGQHRGTDRYIFEQPSFSPDLATALKAQCPQLRLFGFDCISISSRLDREMGRAAHRAFLCEQNILLLEDLYLTPLESAPSSLVVAPLRVDRADGVPCTVLAKK